MGSYIRQPKHIRNLKRTDIRCISLVHNDAGGLMSNLTIRLHPDEKAQLKAWAAARGTSTTDYIKTLVAADMAAGSPQKRAAAWFRENEVAIADEAEQIKSSGVPGAHLALNHPGPDAKI